MSIIKEIHVPDIGDFKNVDVIEVLVAAGDTVDVEAPLIILETDKASMEVPSPLAGVIREVKVKTGDQVSQGDPILYLEVSESVTAAEHPEPATGEMAPPAPDVGQTREVRVPDIGDFKDVPVIEVLVAPGDHVEIDTPLITLESDKASMEVPSPLAGTVQAVELKVGDTVSAGDLVLLLTTSAVDATAKPQLPDTLSAIALGPRAPKAEGAPKPPLIFKDSATTETAPSFTKVHARPSIPR